MFRQFVGSAVTAGMLGVGVILPHISAQDSPTAPTPSFSRPTSPPITPPGEPDILPIPRPIPIPAHVIQKVPWSLTVSPEPGLDRTVSGVIVIDRTTKEIEFDASTPVYDQSAGRVPAGVFAEFDYREDTNPDPVAFRELRTLIAPTNGQAFLPVRGSYNPSTRYIEGGVEFTVLYADHEEWSFKVDLPPIDVRADM